LLGAQDFPALTAALTLVVSVPKKPFPALFPLETRKAWFPGFSEFHVLIVHEIRRAIHSAV